MAKRLYNIHSKEILREKLLSESEERLTLSFYRYAKIEQLQQFRDDLYDALDALGCLGRIYVAHEGINGQISIPASHLSSLSDTFDGLSGFQNMRLNIAVESDKFAFIKLIVRVREKIVADGLGEDEINFSNRGTHLGPEEFNKLADDEKTILIDMRNHYESEVGHFKGAIKPKVATFRESLPIIADMIEEEKDKNILMYCTGGIRCEKASAYFKTKGFDNVYQLDGGIINYTHQVNESGLENKFVGKNFVFDERLGERITEDVIATCHQCGKPSDRHSNCANNACHLLFIQCEECQEHFESCCSKTCQDYVKLSEEDKVKVKADLSFNGSTFSKARYSALTGKSLDVS